MRQRDRAEVAEDLKQIYKSKNQIEAKEKAESFIQKWRSKYPKVAEKVKRRVENLTKFLKYPEAIKRYIYTNNMLERVIKEIRRRTKVIEVFWGEGSLEKVVYLVVRELEERYQSRALIGFKEAREELEVLRRQKYGKINRHN